MKNMIKKMLFVVVMCMSFTLVPNGKAYAAQKMTVSEMKSVTGKTNIPGQWCGTTSQSGACIPLPPVTANNCQWIGANSYPNCTTAGVNDPANPSVCYTQGYYVCQEGWDDKGYQNGQAFCDGAHRHITYNGNFVTGCHP